MAKNVNQYEYVIPHILNRKDLMFMDLCIVM